MRLCPFHRPIQSITAEAAARTEPYAERESVKARQAALAKARQVHAEFLKSLGIEPPRPIVFVPDTPPPKPKRSRGRPRKYRA